MSDEIELTGKDYVRPGGGAQSAGRQAAHALSDAWHHIEAAHSAALLAVALGARAEDEGDATGHGDDWQHLRICAGLILNALNRHAKRLAFLAVQADDYADAFDASARDGGLR